MNDDDSAVRLNPKKFEVYRKMCDLTLAEVCARAGLHRTTIYRALRSDEPVSTLVHVRLLRVFPPYLCPGLFEPVAELERAQ